LIFKSATTLAAKLSILQYKNEGLIESLVLEKRKHKKGRRLNLCCKESSGVEIYSPSMVLRAKAYQAEKDALKQAESEAKEARKIKRAANIILRKQKEAEKEAYQAAMQLVKELASVNPAVPKIPSKTKQPLVHKTRKTSAKMPPKTSTPKALSTKRSKSTAKAPAQVVVEEEVGEVVMQQNRRGRTIKLPERFKNTK
jgi:hypothetical protein